MSKRIVWDDEALNDLDSIAAFIERDSPQAARRVVERIRAAACLLETSPALGMARRDPTVRELVVSRYPYIVVYEIVGDEVHIHSVLHQARDR